jgi:hypothetical protein
MATKRRARRGAPTKIESHPDREKLEFELTIGRPLREVAEKYGLSKSACQRHLKKIPPYLRAANLGQLLAPGVDLERLKHEEGQGLIAVMANQRARMIMIQDRAMELGEHALAVQVSGRIREWSELIAKFLGELVEHSRSTSINVVVTPQFTKLRNIVIDVLRKYPEALADFTARMQAFEAEEMGAATQATAPVMIEHEART